MKRIVFLVLIICAVARAFAANPVPQLDWGVPITIGDFGACDATVATGDSDWAKVNNSANAVVCIDAGDHTGKGAMDIVDGGSAGSTLTISAVSLNDPAQIDFTAAHSLSTNDIIWCDENVGGTWQLRWRYFKVTFVDSDSVTLQGEDASGVNLQPKWTAYTSGGTCKQINFKVIRHTTALSTHPNLLADGSKAKIRNFNCDPSATTADDDYILIWGLSMPDYAFTNTANTVGGGDGCDHFVIAYMDMTASSEVPAAFINFKDGSDYNVLQDTSISLTNRSTSSESVGLNILTGVDGTRVVNNEIWDMTGHGVQTLGTGGFEGTVIAGNYFYTTTAMRADCDGTLNVSGDCACTEKAVEMKNTMTDARITALDQVFRIEANMFSGFRKTVVENTCSGISTNVGAGIGDSNSNVKCCILALNNVMWDMAHGISTTGHSTSVIRDSSFIGNIMYDISHPEDPASGSWDRRAVCMQFRMDGSTGEDNELYFNTCVGTDHWLVSNTSQTGVFRCNLIIDGGTPANVSNLTRSDNYVYGTTSGEAAGDTDGGATSNANMTNLTVTPFIITAPSTETVLPGVLSAANSPHFKDCPTAGDTNIGVSDDSVTF